MLPCVESCSAAVFAEQVSQMLALGVQAGYINSEQDYDSEVKRRGGV